MRKATTRLLSAARLAPATDVEHERRTATAVRAAERDRARRKLAAASAKLSELADKLRDSRARAATEHAQRTSLAGLLRHYLLRLARVEEDVAETLAAERRIMLAQMTAGAKGVRARAVSPAAVCRAAHLASVSPDYVAAVSRWRERNIPIGIWQTTIAGLQWSAPAGTAPHGGSAHPPGAANWLPLEDLATIRRFVVGGVMLDIGAWIGPTSIPRVILGDFAEVCAAEPNGDSYLCLVGNTLDNNVEGRVLPDRVSIAGSHGTHGTGASNENRVPSLTLDEWVARLRVNVADVRFVRLAGQGWGMQALHGAEDLLSRRDIVWQIQLDRATMPDAGRTMADLGDFLSARFSHVKELGGYSGARLYPASEADAVFRAIPGDCAVVNLLLFNVSGGGRRRRGTPRLVRAEAAGDPVEP